MLLGNLKRTKLSLGGMNKLGCSNFRLFKNGWLARLIKIKVNLDCLKRFKFALASLEKYKLALAI